MTAQQAAQAAWNKALADLESHNANTTVYSELKTAEAAVEVAQKNQAVLAGVTNANAILATARAMRRPHGSFMKLQVQIIPLQFHSMMM